MQTGKVEFRCCDAVMVWLVLLCIAGYVTARVLKSWGNTEPILLISH